MPPSGSRKRQQQIYFRSLALPPSNSDSDGEDGKEKKGDYSPHFLAALQLLAHVMVPLRKALVHFYISYRNKDVQKLEWLTLLAFGRLFRDLITNANSSGSSVISGGSSSANNPGSLTGSEALDPSTLAPVSSERFFPMLYTCLLKLDLEKWPKDVTQAIHVLLDCLKCCSRTLPVTNQLWSALLDKACLGLIASQGLVGRRKIESKDQKEVIQRSYTEQVILWCPHVLSMQDISRIPTPTPTDENGDAVVPTLHQLFEADFKKRPLATTSRANFDKKSFDFEVQIPTKFLDKKDIDEDLNGDNNDDVYKSGELWKTTRTMQFASLTGYLFLGIDRNQATQQQQQQTDETEENKTVGKIDRTELAIPATLNVGKLCSKKRIKGAKQPTEAVYELVGGALYDEGEYIAVLKDFSAVAAAQEKKDSSSPKAANSSDSDEDEDETWKLMESEETIPMSESDVLEFLKGEGADDDDEEDDDDDDSEDEDEDDYGPCGTLAVYKLKQPENSKTPTIFDEMNQLLSDIVISQVSGTLNSKTDFYIEEEYEEEIIQD
eukprot:CAMPEP_0116136840 /NCGR_PEP_ID=MMETSP0329-20121206/11943_1 /TAXON_ID=697910 /ORGANISM="Pseudo-nitzschia arenysensis, Strain B593" /LENGTH=549 /DNA_ID=CAMNT_0003631743 /DNA_START=63 /DNA_END=1712 /DNA_ORIENTATION=+